MGIGQQAPQSIDINTAGLVAKSVTWSKWGAAEAVGKGRDDSGQSITLVAYNATTCAGNPAYESLQIQDPIYHPAPYSPTAGYFNLCLGHSETPTGAHFPDQLRGWVGQQCNMVFQGNAKEQFWCGDHLSLFSSPTNPQLAVAGGTDFGYLLRWDAVTRQYVGLAELDVLMQQPMDCAQLGLLGVTPQVWQELASSAAGRQSLGESAPTSCATAGPSSAASGGHD
jgi:hypothetical protein